MEIHECKQETRLRHVETNNATLNTRMDNLTKSLEKVANKIDKFTNATLALIVTSIVGFISGVFIIVVASIILYAFNVK